MGSKIRSITYNLGFGFLYIGIFYTISCMADDERR